MTFVPAPGIVILDAIWGTGEQLVENTYAYRVTGTIDNAKLTAMAVTYQTWAAANTSLFSDQYALEKIYVRDMTTQGSHSVEYNPTSVIDGTDSSAVLPNNVSWALKRFTGLAGRANRGRIYWIGLTMGDLDATNQAITKARANLRITAALALMSSQSTSNGAVEVIYHRKLGTGTDVFSYAYSDLFLDSQRRRLPGHNIHH